MTMVTDHPRPAEVPMMAGPRRRSLIASPGRLVTALCWAGGLLLLISALIHLHLLGGGYRHIPTIVPLFLLQGIAGIALAVVVIVSRQPLAMAGGALFALGTFGGLVLSIEIGLFGFKDRIGAPYATLAVVVESAASVALGIGWLTVWHRGRSAG
jgi:hypothetical protein